MSFQDLESGGGRSHAIAARHQQQQQDPSRSIGVSIFQINTALVAFQRLVASLGTHKDSPDLRRKLRDSRLKIEKLVRETSDKLKQATEADWSAQVSDTKKISDFKLTRDFQYVLKEFQKAQKLAADRESAHVLKISQPALPPSSHTIDVDTELMRSNDQMYLLAETRRSEVTSVENEIAFNEALIEERDQGIKEVQQQIVEVNEIFKDLALLVNQQGTMIDDISSNLEMSAAATSRGTSELTKASKTQRNNSSMTCLMLLIFGIVLLIVVVVLIS